MADFSHLAHSPVTGDSTATYTLYEIKGAPTLTGRPATEDNPHYFAELLKQVPEARRISKSQAISVDVIKANRNDDRKFYAAHILTDWTVRDAKGKAVKFNPDDALKFLQVLPDDVFDGVREFFANAANFRDTVDTGELAKN